MIHRPQTDPISMLTCSGAAPPGRPAELAALAGSSCAHVRVRVSTYVRTYVRTYSKSTRRGVHARYTGPRQPSTLHHCSPLHNGTPQPQCRHSVDRLTLRIFMHKISRYSFSTMYWILNKNGVLYIGPMQYDRDLTSRTRILGPKKVYKTNHLHGYIKNAQDFYYRKYWKVTMRNVHVRA